MSNSEDFRELKDFCSSYFHQDWPTEASNPDEVIEQYLSFGWATTDLRVLAQQMLQFADKYAADAKLEHALFSELGCYYQPSADNMSPRRWLHHAASILLGASEERG